MKFKAHNNHVPNASYKFKLKWLSHLKYSAYSYSTHSMHSVLGESKNNITTKS